MKSVYTIDELRTMLSPIFARHGVKQAVIFGSYSKNSATEKSDVDLLVDSGLRGLRFVGFSEELRSILQKDVDVFDVTHIEPQSPIAREIRDTGVTLYEK